MGKKYITIKTEKEIGKLYLDDIICLEKDLRRIKVSTQQRSFYIYGKMIDLLPFLDERFLHCHRSYIFNMDKIVRVADRMITMENEITIWLGRESFRRAKRAFAAHLDKETGK